MTSVLSLCLAATMIIPAFATEIPTVEGSTEEIAASTHSPMPRDELTNIYTVKFTGFNPGYSWYREQEKFKGSYIPTKVLTYNTNLTTTGSGKTVKVGLGYFKWLEDTPRNSCVTMDLRDSSYATPTLENNTEYFPYVENTTGGVVKGSVSWYRVDRLS